MPLIYAEQPFDAAAPPKLDVLVIGPHPDDAEIGAGGILCKLAAQGHLTGVLDLTAGEMGSGGDVPTRRAESIEAAKVLKVSVRECLELPDCGVTDDYESRCKVADIIKKYRPEVVIGPWYELPAGRGLGHADHIAGGLLTAHGANFAHLKKAPSQYEPWHPKATYFYFLPMDLMPSFVVDVSDFFDGWIESIMCHHSQFGRPEQNPGIRTFFEGMATRWARWGGGRYAQAFYSPWPLNCHDVLTAARVYKPAAPGTAPVGED